MAKPSIDDLLLAVEAVQRLQDVVGNHDKAISLILDRLDALNARLDSMKPDGA